MVFSANKFTNQWGDLDAPSINKVLQFTSVYTYVLHVFPF